MRSALSASFSSSMIVDRRVGRGAGDGVAAEGRDRQRLERRGDLGRRDRRAERQPVRDALGHRHDVGLDAPVLDAPHRAARAPEARLHLVADEDAAVLADDRDRDLEVLRRRRDEAADALDRLGEEAAMRPVVVVRISSSMSFAHAMPQDG